jgi:hypothetical protein
MTPWCAPVEALPPPICPLCAQPHRSPLRQRACHSLGLATCVLRSLHSRPHGPPPRLLAAGAPVSTIRLGSCIIHDTSTALRPRQQSAVLSILKRLERLERLQWLRIFRGDTGPACRRAVCCIVRHILRCAESCYCWSQDVRFAGGRGRARTAQVRVESPWSFGSKAGTGGHRAVCLAAKKETRPESHWRPGIPEGRSARP